MFDDNSNTAGRQQPVVMLLDPQKKRKEITRVKFLEGYARHVSPSGVSATMAMSRRGLRDVRAYS